MILSEASAVSTKKMHVTAGPCARDARATAPRHRGRVDRTLAVREDDRDAAGPPLLTPSSRYGKAS